MAEFSIIGSRRDDFLPHDEKSPNATLAYLLSRLGPPDFPEIFGVFRAVDYPTYEHGIYDQIRIAREKHGEGDLDKLMNAGDTWTVK